MAGVNKVILVGNLGKDPEVRYLDNGVAVANFSLATTENYKNKVQESDKEKWCMMAIWIGRSQGNYKAHPEFLYENIDDISNVKMIQGEKAHSGV